MNNKINNTMTDTKQILYLGAWDHFDPIIHFPNCKKFIYIDTQPRTEWDFYPNSFDYNVYRNRFIDTINIKLAELNFDLIEITHIDPLYIKNLCSYNYDFDTGKSSHLLSQLNDVELKNILNKYQYITPHLFVYYNELTQQTIKYYISTNIKYTMTDELRNDIASSDSLICAGYSPDRLLLDYIIKPINFYGYTGTVYTPDEDFTSNEINKTLFNYLFFNQNNENILKLHFKSFNIVNKQTGIILQVGLYIDFLLKMNTELKKLRELRESYDEIYN